MSMWCSCVHVICAVIHRVGRISESQQKVVRAKAAFCQLDPAEAGFIQADKLRALLSALNAPVFVDASAAASRVVSSGIILWDDVRNNLDFLLGDANASSNGPSASSSPSVISIPCYPSGPWSCQACTFSNANEQAASCEICGTPRPPPPAPQAAQGSQQTGQQGGSDDPNEHPSNFAMFHFNGISNHANARATCCRVTVSLLGEGVQARQSDTGKRGLREVIQTRWPSGLVEYDANKPDPKIV